MSTSTTNTAQIHDLLLFESLLDPQEQSVLDKVRSYLADLDDTTLNRAWENAEFPFGLVQSLAEHGLLGQHLHTGQEPSHLLRGLLTAELARKDASLATFVGVSGSLFGLSVRRFGSPVPTGRNPAGAWPPANWSALSRSPSRTRAPTSPGA